MDARTFFYEEAFLEALVGFILQHDLVSVSFVLKPPLTSYSGTGAAVERSGMRLGIECRSNREWPLDVFACCADEGACCSHPNPCGAAYSSQCEQQHCAVSSCSGSCATSRMFRVEYDIASTLPFLLAASENARDGRGRAKRLSEQLRSFAIHVQRHLAVCSATRNIPHTFNFLTSGSWELGTCREQFDAWLPISWARDVDGILGAAHYATAPSASGSFPSGSDRTRIDQGCEPEQSLTRSQLLLRLRVAALLNVRVPQQTSISHVWDGCPLLAKLLQDSERDDPQQRPVLFILHSVDGVLQTTNDPQRYNGSGACMQAPSHLFETLMNFTVQHLTHYLDLSVVGTKAEVAREGNARRKSRNKASRTELRTICCRARSTVGSGTDTNSEGRCACSRVLGSAVDHLGCCFFLGCVGQNTDTDARTLRLADAPFQCVGLVLDWPGDLLRSCFSDDVDIARRRSSLATLVASRVEAAVIRLVSENRDVWCRSAAASVASRCEATRTNTGCKRERSPPRVSLSYVHTAATVHSIVESLTSIIWASPHTRFVLDALHTLANSAGSEDTNGSCAVLRRSLSTLATRGATMAPQSLFDALSLTPERLRTIINGVVQQATAEIPIGS